MAAGPTEKFAKKIASMDRDRLVLMLRELDCDFTLDFSDEFLAGISLERLRHITLAALLHAHNAV